MDGNTMTRVDGALFAETITALRAAGLSLGWDGAWTAFDRDCRMVARADDVRALRAAVEGGAAA